MLVCVCMCMYVCMCIYVCMCVYYRYKAIFFISMVCIYVDIGCDVCVECVGIYILIHELFDK